jgi:hypothetical protein
MNRSNGSEHQNEQVRDRNDAEHSQSGKQPGEQFLLQRLAEGRTRPTGEEDSHRPGTALRRGVRMQSSEPQSPQQEDKNRKNENVHEPAL